MLKLILSAAVLMVGSCYIEDPDGKMKISYGKTQDGELQDKEPLYAEFKLKEIAGSNEAHVAVKITYKDQEPVKMYIKDLREEAKTDPVEELDVYEVRRAGKIYNISAKSDTQEFKFSNVLIIDDTDNRYFFEMAVGNLTLEGYSTELNNGEGKLTEKKWDELTQTSIETAATTPSPQEMPLTDDEKRYLESNCFHLLSREELGRIRHTQEPLYGYIYYGNNCKHSVLGLSSPDVARYLIRHQLMCGHYASGNTNNFAVADRNRDRLHIIDKKSREKFRLAVDCKDTDSVYFYMENGKLHVDMKDSDGTEGTYIVQEPK